MKQSISRRQFLKASGLAAAGACAAGLLSSCGGKSGGSSSGSASGADTSKYTVLYSSQPATLNYLTTATDLEMVVGANCVDTLVEYDNKGVMREGLATKWEWDADTLTWTFTLREENWVDNNGEVVAPVTAQDFVDALHAEGVLRCHSDDDGGTENAAFLEGFQIGLNASAAAGIGTRDTQNRLHRVSHAYPLSASSTADLS